MGFSYEYLRYQIFCYVILDQRVCAINSWQVSGCLSHVWFYMIVKDVLALRVGGRKCGLART